MENYHLRTQNRELKKLKVDLRKVRRHLEAINDRLIDLNPERLMINGENHSETMASSIVNASVKLEEEKLPHHASEPVSLSGQVLEPEELSESVSVASVSDIDEPRPIKRKRTKKNFAPLMALHVGRKRALTEEVASGKRDPHKQLAQAIKTWLQSEKLRH